MKVVKLAIRSILSFRTYSGINVLGMALSLACVITIFRYVYGELTVDRFNKKIDRIFVTTNERSNNPGAVNFSGIENRNRETTFVDMREHPGVEHSSQFIWFEHDEIDVEDRKYNATVLVADSNFMKLFDYPVISGIHKLSEPNSALITQRFAQKLFGNETPVGKTLRHSSGEFVTISGVIGQTPAKSTLAFDMIVSFHLVNPNMWGKVSQTFVLLYHKTDYQMINKQYADFFDMPRWGYQIRYQLFPLSEVYFDKSIGNYIFKKGNYAYVNVLTAVGFLILLAGIINYINIFTVVILRRGREFGIKKVFGAEGYNIFMQLFVESLLMTGMAIMFALAIVNVANPLIINMLQFDQLFNLRFDMTLIFMLLLLLPVITTLYPFFRYNYRKPVTSLYNVDMIRRRGSLRRTLLSFQYVITMIMIIVSLFFVKQLQFMMNADPGYRTKDIIKVRFLNRQTNFASMGNKWENSRRIADEIKQEVNACPLFTNWAFGESPNEFLKRETLFKLPDGEFLPVHLHGCDEGWLRLFDIQLKEGRLWDDTKDVLQDYLLIVTESVLKLYGITDFNDALLQSSDRIWLDFSKAEEMKINPPYRIVGVVKDFNYLHLSQKSDPIAFYYTQGDRFDWLMASIVPGRTQDAIDFLRNLHEETVGGEFSYSFVEDEVREMYAEDKKIATIYAVFTFIAIFVSVLGLFSMSLFDIQQRRKEIAIRKINGASFHDIVRLLLKKYFLTLGISVVIASPVALLAINRYLEDFAHKAPVSWWLFAVAAVLTTGISLLTLIVQTRKAANQNPAEVVKSE